MSNTTPVRKTQIIATIGPGSEIPEKFAELLHAGINITRNNMSHGDHEEHQKRIDTIRKVSAEQNIPVKLLLDLSGPKIRIGDFVNSPVEIVPGAQFILSGTQCEGTHEKVYFNYPNIEQDIKVGQMLMLDDGRRKLRVDKVEGTDIYTTVMVGGMIKSRRGVNIPMAYLSISAITEKDKVDLAFGIKNNVDYIAISFVRTAKDIIELRELIKAQGGNQPIIAKIETPEAVEKIDEIIAATDAIMVARGDLAVEVGHVKVPGIQKMLIKKCNAVGKPVIVATQMMETMISAPVPTRAEVSDVANAVYDGADAVMLSEESAMGSFATEAVTMMSDILVQVEAELNLDPTKATEWKSK